MSDIIKANQSAELSEGKRRQYHRESMKMISRGLALGFHGRLVVAAALWNIRELALHELEDLTLKEFAEKSGIGESTMYAYLQVGDRLRSATQDKSLPIITQNDVKEIFESSVANAKDFTLRGLFKAAQSQEAFHQYLTTGKEDEAKAEAAKLLKARKLTEEELEREAAAERMRAEAADRVTTWGHAWARRHGVRWDSERKEWLNEDGSELSERQIAEMTSYSDALAVFEKAVELLADASADLYKIIHSHGETFRIYVSERATKNFTTEVDAHQRTAMLRLDVIRTMMEHLYEGRPAEAEDCYKKY